MSNLKVYGALDLAEEAHRNGENKHANHIKNTSKTPFLNTNIFPKNNYENLRLLALKMACNCFSLKPSREVIRDFIIEIEKMRNDYVK